MIGASWYLLSIGRQFSCWQTECAKENAARLPVPCLPAYLDCNSLLQPERQAWLNATRVTAKCDARDGELGFIQFGMFADAFTNDVVTTTSFMEKYLYCLWWGLRNLRCVILKFGPI